MISLNIDLLQLNDLYYAVSKHTKDCEQQIKEYGDSSYFVTQLERAKELETIVQDALYKRCDELDEAIQYIDEVVEKYKDEDTIAEQREDAKYEKAFSIHFVTNEEADEDAGIKESDKFNGVSQFILDFVEANDVVSYSEMNDMYKAYTKGSNSFSHILKALRIPYKNRPTKRYLVKHHLGGYMVRTATPHNWVVNY
jgi:hypothetical protein